MAGQHGFPRRGRAPGLDLALGLILSVAAVALSLVAGAGVKVIPWALAVAAVDALLVLLRRWRPEFAAGWTLLLLGLLAALASAALQLGGFSALPLLLIPAVQAGQWRGVEGALVVGWVNLIVGFSMSLAFTVVLDGLQVIGVMIAAFLTSLVASRWSTPPNSGDALAAQEAKALLIRLGSLADSLDTGFDLPALGDWGLAEVDDEVGIERGAVLLRTVDDAVVIGLRGHTRMPWSAPTESDSVLHLTWQEAVSVRSAFGAASERVFMLTVPLVGADGTALGMMAVDRSSGPFTAADQRSVEAVAQRMQPLVEVGVLFSRLRGRAAVEERARLARDIHDGVAQELAALAFSVDALMQRTTEDAAVREGLEALRGSLRHSLGDLRNHISTLRMVQRPGVSLGAILSTTLQEFATSSSVRTMLSMDESPFRFPAHVEMQIQRLAVEVLADARGSGATFVDWNVALQAPNARLILMHDGHNAGSPHLETAKAVYGYGEVSVETLVPQGLYVEVALGNDPPPTGRAGAVRPERSRTEVDAGPEGSLSEQSIPKQSIPKEALQA